MDEWCAMVVWWPGPQSSGFHLCVGVRQRRSWWRQLQLWRLHQQHIHAVNRKRNWERTCAMVFGGMFFNVGCHLQQWLWVRTTDCKCTAQCEILAVRLFQHLWSVKLRGIYASFPSCCAFISCLRQFQSLKDLHFLFLCYVAAWTVTYNIIHEQFTSHSEC